MERNKKIIIIKNELIKPTTETTYDPNKPKLEDDIADLVKGVLKGESLEEIAKKRQIR